MPGFTSIGALLGGSAPELASILDGSFLPDTALSLLAGPSPHGKSGLALQIARAAAERTGRPVLVFSREGTTEQLVSRLLATEAGIDRAELQRRGMHAMPGARERLAEAAARIERLPLHIAGEIALLPRVAEESRRIARHRGTPALIVLDYLQLFGMERDEEAPDVPVMAQTLATLARDLKAPVLAVSGLEWSGSEVVNPRPSLSDLGRWGLVASIAECVLLVHRPNVHKDGGLAQNRPGPIEITVVKHPRATGRVVGTIIPSLRTVLPAR